MLETTTNLPNTKAEHIQPALLQVQGNDNDMLEGVMEVEVVNEPSIKKGEGGWNRGCYKGGPSKFLVKGGGRENKTIEDGGSIL